MTTNQLINYYTAAYGTQYLAYIKRIDALNGGKTADWLDAVIQNNGTLQDALAYFDNFFRNHPSLKAKTISNYRSGYIKFAEVVLGLFSANTWLTRSQGGSTFYLCRLIADNAIFASKDVVDKVINGQLGSKENIKNGGNQYASWDYMAHIRHKNHKQCPIIPDTSPFYPLLKKTYPLLSPNILTDDNTTANRAIKTAVLKSFELKFGPSGCDIRCFNDYEACHIWELTTDDRRYYTSIANLVLIPRSLAALSDHFPAVKALLQYEAFKRFGFLPAGKTIPKFNNYNKITWRYSF